MSPLLGPAEIRELAARLDLNPRKSLGQNFVIDANTILRIVRTAQLAADDVVLEVGPGLGSLTLGLLPAVAGVVAVEIDGALAGQLPLTVAAHAPELAPRLTVVHADALKLAGPADLAAGSAPAGLVAADGGGGSRPPPDGAGPPTALVANLPYNVAVPVLLTCLARFPTIRTALVLVQLEVADRLAAGPGSKVYGVPSVKAAWFGPTRRVGTVGPSVFWPVPHVDSGLVRLDRRATPPVDPNGVDPGRERVFEVVDAAFAQRRKTLRAGMAGWFGSPALAEQHLRAAGVDPGARAEQLGVDSFVALAATTVAAGLPGDGDLVPGGGDLVPGAGDLVPGAGGGPAGPAPA